MGDDGKIAAEYHTYDTAEMEAAIAEAQAAAIAAAIAEAQAASQQ